MARLVTILGYVCLFTTAMHAATFTVTTTADSGAGSLRQAVIDSNANGAGVADVIEFDIAAAGVQTITLATALPQITTPVVIDGYTQTGASANTLNASAGNNAVILIALDGVNESFMGLTLYPGSDGSFVRGLAVQRFSTGIYVASTNVTIAGNYIGTNAAGTADLGNGYGIFLENGDDNDIGGIPPSLHNVISGNNTGVSLSAQANGNTVAGNYIGTTADGMSALGNLVGVEVQLSANNVIFDNLISGNSANLNSAGINISGSSTGNIIAGNSIGTTRTNTGSIPNRFGISFTSFVMGAPTDNTIGTAAEPNTINNNLSDGIVVEPGLSARNRIEYNAFLDNGGLAIDLANNGADVNDPLDEDGGANFLQNYPVITSATQAPSNAVAVSGTLASTPLTQFNVQLYYTVTCDPSGFGEGGYVAETTTTTDAAGNAAFNFALPFLPPGGNVTALATDSTGNTSELSACAALVPGAQPTLSIDNQTVTEGNAGTTPAIFTVTLSQPSASTITVLYAAVDDTANQLSDFSPAADMLTFAPGETTKQFTVNVLGDTTVEPNETFNVFLSQPNNATIADGTGVGTILNDDAAATVNLSIAKTGPATVTAGSNINWTITVANQGATQATGVTVTDILPAGVTFVSATPSQGSCSGTTTVTCTLGTLNAAASATIALVATAPITPQPVSNTATVTANETDTPPANNASTSTVTVGAALAAVPFLDGFGLAAIAALLIGLALLRLR